MFHGCCLSVMSVAVLSVRYLSVWNDECLVYDLFTLYIIFEDMSSGSVGAAL